MQIEAKATAGILNPPILTWLEVYPLVAAAFMRSPLQEQPCEIILKGEVSGAASERGNAPLQQQATASSPERYHMQDRHMDGRAHVLGVGPGIDAAPVTSRQSSGCCMG